MKKNEKETTTDRQAGKERLNELKNDKPINEKEKESSSTQMKN